MNWLHIHHMALCIIVMSIHNNLVANVLVINYQHNLALFTAGENVCCWCGLLKESVSMFSKLIVWHMLHKPNDKGRMSGRADTVRLV